LSRISWLAALVAAVAAVALAQPAFAATPNNNPATIVVLNNNVENFPQPDWPSVRENPDSPYSPEQCRGRASDLRDIIRQGTIPDIVTLQQAYGSKDGQYDFLQFRDFLSSLGAGPYQMILTPRLANQTNSSTCGANDLKKEQRSAIFYRDDRFNVASGAPADGTVWRSYKLVNGSCQLDDEERSQNINIFLTDVFAGKTVKVASIHWPSGRSGGHECATKNAEEAHSRSTRNSPDLQLVNGDTNFIDYVNMTDSSDFRRNEWYNYMAARYRDAADNACRAEGKTSPSDLKTCLQQTAWTGLGEAWLAGDTRRRDFIFARTASGAFPGMFINRAIEWPSFAYPYSQHRALFGAVYY
jgi:hypothetical protein